MITKTIAEVEAEIVDDFSILPDQETKYDYIIEMGAALPPLDEQYKTPENIVRGCQSQVWLRTSVRDGRIMLEAESDSVLTKGLIAMLLRVLNGRTPEEIVSAELGFIDKIGLRSFLTEKRSNGLTAMIDRIQAEARRLL